jgi:hypothetical protein
MFGKVGDRGLGNNPIGKADGQQMFMKQKYKVSGNPAILMRFGELFGKQPND